MKKNTYTNDEKIAYYRSKIEWASKRIEQLENIKINGESKQMRDFFGAMTPEEKEQYIRKAMEGYAAHGEAEYKKNKGA